MCKDLLALCWRIRYKAKTAVKRSLLKAIHSCVIVPFEVYQPSSYSFILKELQEDLDETMHWVSGMLLFLFFVCSESFSTCVFLELSTNESDDECRLLADVVMVEMDRIFKQDPILRSFIDLYDMSKREQANSGRGFQDMYWDGDADGNSRRPLIVELP
jgi:hypothetical protein